MKVQLGRNGTKEMESNRASELGIRQSYINSHHQPGWLLSPQAGCAAHLHFSHVISADSIKLYIRTLLVATLGFKRQIDNSNWLNLKGRWGEGAFFSLNNHKVQGLIDCR